MSGALSAGQPWPAPAKLNLFLHVTGRRADGYHELQTVFQFLDWGDSLWFTLRDDAQITRPDGPAGVAVDEDLSVRAARALQAATGCRRGAEIRIDKRIPLGGGLGGGSSDAATTLVALNRLWQLDLDDDALAAIGLRLGADVPVFVRGQAAWAEGIGDRLRPLALDEPWYLVLTPACAINTGAMFRHPALDRAQAPIDPAAFRAGRGGNAFTALVRAEYPAVAAALDALSQLATARLSGTGSSVFAAFASRAEAQAARDALGIDCKHFIARGCNQSPLRLVSALPLRG